MRTLLIVDCSAVCHKAFSGFDGSMGTLVKTIEEEGKEKELREIVGDVWQEIERSLRVKRKKRYE